MEILEQLENIKKSVSDKYPKQQLLTDNLFAIVVEMLSVDYRSISSGGKRIAVFKEYMLSLIKQALENGGQKNYMLDLINVFKNTIIFDYLSRSFGNKSNELRRTIDVSYDILFAWQGFEGQKWRRMETIEKMFRAIK